MTNGCDCILLEKYQQELDEEQRAVFLAYANEGCTELLQLITNILDVNQIGKKHEDVPLEPIEIAPVLRDIVDQWDPRTRQDHKIDLEISEHVIVQASPQYLRQILRNLLSNALKYSPPHSHITISAAIASPDHLEALRWPSVYISVKDEGPGIPPDDIPLLFNAFTRLKRDLVGPVRGTGLGLFICKQLVEAMHGQIWVESAGKVGEGSCFCFFLPSAAPEQMLSASDPVVREWR